MRTIKFVCIFTLLAILALTGLACTKLSAGSQEEGRTIALEFVKKEATFQFDGIPETLEVISTTAVENGWKYTIEFDSRHAGYGDRSGQILAEVITPHTAEVTVQDSQVASAFMDGQWDMIGQRINVEIIPAPIDEVKVSLLKSNPPQISVYIRGGLPDGCTTFHDIETTREGSTINIKVTVQRPRGVFCPAIYTQFERDVNLGSDFAFGTTFTLNVNDYSTTFEGTLMENEGFAVYLTRDDISPAKMEALSHVEIAGQPVISIQDIIAYNAQTHELELTEDAFNRIAGLEVPVSGKSFLVCVNKEPVYWGAFWPPFSSMSFSGIVILQPPSSREYRVTIDPGYPAPSFFEGEDPRNNPDVLNSLELSGKLVNQPPVSSGE